MKNRIATTTITEIGGKGDGIGEYEGKPVYASKTAPGDVAEVLLSKHREGYSATIHKLITPGPDRVAPPCPYFDKCGSCSLQHVSEEFYHNWKIAKVQNALTRAGVKYEQWNDPIFLPAATRRRASMAAIMVNGVLRFGYNESRTHKVLDIKKCLIVEPELDKKLFELRAFLPRLLPANKAVDLTLHYIDGAYDMVLTGPYMKRGRFNQDQDEALGELVEKLDIARVSYREKDFGPLETILSRKAVTKTFGAIKVALPPASFLQATQDAEDVLVKIVLENTKGAKNLADLFAGCGTFAGHMLDTGAKVYAADGHPLAINALAATKHPNLTAARRDLFKSALSESELAAFDAVVLDPPRAGAAIQAENLAWSKVPKIVAISCNPATFARDALTLQNGGYKLQSVTLIDQFVYAAHVEVAGIFVK